MFKYSDKYRDVTVLWKDEDFNLTKLVKIKDKNGCSDK